jgi:hypothetical protein
VVNLQTIGTGEEIEISEFAGLSTIFPILYNHRDQKFQSALLQGMPSVSAGSDQVTIDFQTLFGFYPALQESEQTHKVSPAYSIGGKPLEETRKGELERSAFKYGAHIFRACYTLLGNMQLTGSDMKYATTRSTVDNTEYVEIVIDTLKAMRDRVIDSIENQIVLYDKLRDNGGHYRWIGLNTANVKLTTPLILPRLIGGQRDLYMTASVMPSNGSTFIKPRDDDVAHAVVSGMIHGFEGRRGWDESTAIRASLFHYTYGDAISPELLFSAASRAGLTPRLGTMLSNRPQSGGMGAWRYLAALALSYDFFRTYYLSTFGKPVGSVQYGFSGGGVAQILESKIKRYISAASVTTKDEVSPSPGGLTFLPSTNAPDQQYGFSFVMRNQRAWTEKVRDVTRITQYDGETLRANYQPMPVNISKEMYVIQPEEDRNNDNWRPVIIQSVPSVIRYRDYVGIGLHATRMRIKDKVDQRKARPSEMLASLMLGWTPSFDPAGLIFSDMPVGSGIRDIYKLQDVRTVSNSQRPGEGFIAP